jgi:hypothetical protein
MLEPVAADVARLKLKFGNGAGVLPLPLGKSRMADDVSVCRLNADMGLRPVLLENDEGADAAGRAGKTNGGFGSGAAREDCIACPSVDRGKSSDVDRLWVVS